jgi:hypothetical protein
MKKQLSFQEYSKKLDNTGQKDPITLMILAALPAEQFIVQFLESPFGLTNLSQGAMSILSFIPLFKHHLRYQYMLFCYAMLLTSLTMNYWLKDTKQFINAGIQIGALWVLSYLIDTLMKRLSYCVYTMFPESFNYETWARINASTNLITPILAPTIATKITRLTNRIMNQYSGDERIGFQSLDLNIENARAREFLSKNPELVIKPSDDGEVFSVMDADDQIIPIHSAPDNPEAIRGRAQWTYESSTTKYQFYISARNQLYVAKTSQLYSKQLGFRLGANEREEGVYTQYMTDGEQVYNNAENSIAKSILTAHHSTSLALIPATHKLDTQTLSMYLSPDVNILHEMIHLFESANFNMSLKSSSKAEYILGSVDI